jgi:hypothetical protein
MNKINTSEYSLLATLQGWYFLITGIWPILHIRSFLAVTGPKREVWLVKTFGAVISVVGFVLLLSGMRKQPAVETGSLAIGSAGLLAASDIVYVTKCRISPVYLFDAAIELVLLLLWVQALRQRPFRFVPGNKREIEL